MDVGASRPGQVLLAQPRLAGGEGAPRVECEFHTWFGIPARL